jgi:DNA-binding transcriptional ArsR family regulator
MSKQGTTSEESGQGCCQEIDGLLEARFFKALCDPSRIGILVRLARSCEPQKVSEVASCCPTNISVVSRHLATLREAGILRAQKRGKEVYYSVRYPELVSTLRAMADAIEACCPG